MGAGVDEELDEELDDERDPERDPEARERDARLRFVLVGAAVLRLAAVIGQHAFVYTDSIDYETLDFSGGSRRPWVTPLLYELIEDPALRIVWQGAIGAACWSYLGLRAAALVEDRCLRWCVLLTVLAVSLTTTVTNWDTAMLSESLALSFTALLLGAVLRFWKEPTFTSTGIVLASWLLWIFTRQAHLVPAGLITLVLAVVLAVHGRRTHHLHRPLATLVAGLALLCGVGVVSYAQNTEIVHYNLAQVIGNRTFPNADRSEWFTDHGMPVPEANPLGQAAAPQDLLKDRDFERWIERDAIGTYVEYLVTHPWETVTGPFEDLASDRGPFGDIGRADEVMLATPDSYGVGRQVLPSVVEDLVFDPGQAGGVLFGLVVALGLTLWRWRRRGPDRRWLVPLLALAIQWPALTAVWVASTAELGRLALPSALVIRVAIVLQLALLADAWLVDRRPPEPA